MAAHANRFPATAAGPAPARIGPARIGLYVFLLASACVILMPIYVMIATALKTMSEIRGGNVLLWPSAPDLVAWVKAWSGACIGLECTGIHVGFWNSVRIVVPSVILAVLLGAVNGYCLSFWRFRGANLMFGVMLFAIFIPYQVFVFPMIAIAARLGLYGKLAGVILAHVVFGLPIMTLMFRNYFATLPPELFKAARVDGAGFWRIFLEIMMPMAKPIVVVAVIWQATASWNDYLLGLVFAGRENLPMTAQLNLLVSAEMGAHEYNVDMAATVQTALIPLIVYFVSGKWFARGIAAGAVKG
ncbi:MAG TPA: carbohydrate ABC transporter permease [Ramlibacter sp.]|nr:carbohydrate ABC transporter permease [Ramlibacter sp.]